MEYFKINEGSREAKATVRTEECLIGFLWNGERRYQDVLSENFPSKINEQYLFLVGYVTKDTENIYERVSSLMSAVLARTLGVEMIQTENRIRHILIALLKGTERCIARYLDSLEACMIHSNWKEETVWASRSFLDMREGYEVFWKAYGQLKYGLTFGSGHILRNFDEESFSADEIEYPISLERQVGAAVGRCEKENCLEKTEKFLQQITAGIHQPEDIRYAANRLLQHMREITKESNMQAYDELRNQNMEERIANANNRNQLSEIMEKVCEITCNKHNEKRNNNYNINRALEYIRIHYGEGVTLEETARELNITPEYLSVLFKREVGINFSVFLKRFRISHAKRLLKETDMKVHEIAAACGYSNSNYFIKVFREVTGTVPTEYR